MRAISGVGLRGAVLAMAALALACASARAAPRTIAEYGRGTARVVNPTGVAVDRSTGELYVADRNNFRIDKFGPGGEFLLAWGWGVADGRSQELQVCGPAAEPPSGRCFMGLNAATGPGVVVPQAAAVDQGSGDVYVADANNSRVSKFTPAGELLFLFGPDVTFSGPGNTGANEQQAVTVKATAGAFALSLTAPVPLGASAAKETTAPIPYNASHEEVQAALEALPNVEAGDLSVSGGPGDATGSSPYEVDFVGGPFAGNDVAQMSADSKALVGPQTVTVQGAAGGTFKLTFEGKETAPVPYNASAAQVQAALVALTTIGAGNVAVSGAAGGPWTVTFAGALAGSPQPPIGASRAGKGYELTPSTAGVSVAQPATVATAVPGGGPEVCEPGRGDVCKAASAGGGPGELTNPRSLALNPEGHEVWVGDTDRLVEFDSSGDYLSEIALPGAGGTASLAIDSAGDFYLKSQSLPGIRKLEAGTGALLETLDAAGQPLTVTLDEADNVYVGDSTTPYRFKVYNPAGEQVAQFGAGQVIGTPSGNAIAVDEGGGTRPATLYSAGPTVSDVDNAVQAFPLPGPGPLIGDQRAEAVEPTSATLAATLNPEGEETAYHFEYDTTPYEGEAEHGTRVPASGPDPSLPASFEEEALQVPLEGLIADTTYHFRLCATNSGGSGCGPDTAFTTRTAVGIEAQWATDIAARSATVHAQLDPLGVEGHWWLEYGTGAAYGSRGAAFALPASFGALPVALALGGLQPATTYHYRFVAEDEREGTPYTTHGEDRTFTTQLAGLGFGLPDRRAWEMVSPPDKHGGRIATFDHAQGGQVQAAAGGEALAYLSYGSLEADPEGNRLIEQSSELARRGPGGSWSTRDITPPHATVTSFGPGSGLEYKLFSTDLERALLQPRECTALSVTASERTPYVRENGEPPVYLPLVTSREGYADVPVGIPPFDGDCTKPVGPVNVKGASPDLRHVVIGSAVPLAKGVSGTGLYEWTGGGLQPVSVPPEEVDAVPADLGSGGASVRGAVSADGSRVFWTSGGLYVRDMARGETVQIDDFERYGGLGTGEPKPLFQGTSADGSVAFFTDTQSLTAGSSEEGADLYRWRAEGSGGCEEAGGCLDDLSAPTVNPEDPFESAEVQGLLLGFAEDGSSAYLAARGVLADNTANNGAGSETASPGQPNLYAWSEGEGMLFVAGLSEDDERNWGWPGNGKLLGVNLTTTTSPSGRFLAFMSKLPLTGYDNRDASSGERVQEVFRYDTQSGKLTCVSCNPSGARPRARVPGPKAGQLAEEFDPQQLWLGQAVAAVVPEATKIDDGAGISLYRPRYVHDDGRIFFNAADSLVPADSNGDGDVYEYEPVGTGTCGPSAGDAGTATVPGGCVSLISSGTAEGTSAFLDASEGARDVFFYSPAKLSVTDEDEELDVYDAREEGEPAVLSPRAECQGEACQPPAIPPEAQTPASAAFHGPGNPHGGRKRCPRGRHMVRRHGKARCVKRRHRKRHPHTTESIDATVTEGAVDEPAHETSRRPAGRRLGALCAACATSAGAAEAKPWWQLLTGSRPTYLQPAPDPNPEVQELKTSKNSGSFAGAVEVGGEVLACLGSGAFSGLCGKTGFAPIETAAQLQEALEEGPYGPGGVTVSGGPVGGEAFIITTPGWVTPVVVEPFPFGEFSVGFASWEVKSQGSGRLVLTLTDLGDGPVDATSDPVTIHGSLPPRVQAYGAQAIAGATGEAGSVECALPDTSKLTCVFEGELPPYEAIEVEVLVALEEGAADGATGTVSISGGGATAVSRPQVLSVSAAPVPFGLEYFSMRAEAAGGGAVPTADGGEEATAAGAHPFQLTTTIVANTGAQEGPSRRAARVGQPALPRNLRFTLPAGLVGNATAVATCEMASFLHRTKQLTNDCPADSAIGASSATFIESNVTGLARIAVPVFNLVPGQGEPARFGLMIGGDSVLIDTSVDPDDSYRIIAEVRNISQVVQFLAATTTFWGDPGAEAHDASRGWKCVYHWHGVEDLPGECKEPTPAERHDTPLLRMPVSCADPLGYEAAMEPWNVPLGSVLVPGFAESPPPLACNQVPFDPHISDALTSKLASNPSGLDIRIDMPGEGLTNPKEGAISEAQFKRAEVIFPRGVTINPSQAEGLAVCSEADYGRERYDSTPGEGCPQASKIGSIRISTPLLGEEASGALFVATPYENPTGSMLALYVVARIPDRGILVKQPIEVRPDPQTGQLVGISDDVPQLPFSSFDLHFREGGRSPLITPPGCGTFHTLAKFTPWSAQDPDNPAPGEVVERGEATFTIERGVDGGPCTQGPAPFHPGFEAGTLNNQAGSYSPFVMHLTRSDGEQDMGRFSFVLPPGVVPKLAGIPYCPDAAIAQAMSRQGPHGGAEEKGAPSCPAASEIGSTVAGAGVGNQLTYVPGRLYLAGPYHGDPISAVSITPAVAGPFDAGTVVVREALRLNPVTHVGEVDGSASDPIPHILKGIPLNLRDLRVYADRPQFTLNATSCEPFEASSTIWGDGTALAPLAQTPVTLASRYQAAGCASLGFKPRLALKLEGGTKRGAHPALKALVTPRAGDANFAGAVVTLPHSAFLDQAHIRTICTRVQFAAGAGNGAECPAGSVYGQAKAWSPLLDEPLQGPVFLRSSSHNLPDLVVALHGLVDIDLAARIDSVHGGIRSTFADVPDAPVSRFVLEMQGAKKGLIVNSTDLCAGKHRARAELTGQNGRVDNTKPLVRAVGCGKAHRARHRSHRRS